MSDFDEASASRKRPAPSPTGSVTGSVSASKRSKSSKSSPNSSDRSNKGLRHFSMMVCKKVEEMGTTTYAEVADELVKKVVAERPVKGGKYDEKNIRRRVYDALNVLMAMDIISKDKKEISWKGLPSNNQDLDYLRDEVEFREAQLGQKKDALKELLVQQVCFRNLIWRNHQRSSEEKIPLPFILVNTNAAAVIQCDMSRDRTDVMFDFSMPFEINDDNTILKKMGLGKTSPSVLTKMLPSDMYQYCQDNNMFDAVVSSQHHHPRSLPSVQPRPQRHQPEVMPSGNHRSRHHAPPPPHHAHYHRGVPYPPHPYYGGYEHPGAETM